MTPDQQFWWNWWVQFFTAFGTISAVLVALFGQWIRALFPPDLHISVPEPRGEASPFVRPQSNGQKFRTDSRWFHVQVENKRRLTVPATDVQVLLLRVEEFENNSNAWRVAWASSEIPITWKNQNTKPPALKIGRPDGCDLFSIVNDEQPFLAIYPLVPVYSLNTQWHAPCRLRFTLQARSVEVDSDILQVEIIWNGRWNDDPTQMVTVNSISSPRIPQR